MRSTKDLKEIVTGSRTKSKMNGIAGEPGRGFTNDGDNTSAADDDEAVEYKKKGNWEQKFKS